MVDLEYWMEKAAECGFSHVGELDVDTIELRQEARDACAENKCHSYGKNWSCPPGCGTLEECDARIRKYKKGVLVQTTGEVDSLDFESFMELGANHGANFKKFAALVREELPGAMLIGVSACENCAKCTYPDAPCRFPDKLSHPMEGLGMIVSDVCKANGLKYYYGPGTLTYTGCVLLE